MNAETLSSQLPRQRIGPQGRADPAESSVRAAVNFSALGEMTGGIAHDIRNILCVIASGLRVAERNSADPVKRRAALAAAHDGVDRGLRMVAGLLAFPTRPELTGGPQDVSGLLRNLESFLKYGAGPGNRVVLELGTDLPKCAVGPAQFNAAILNLVINARDALKQRGTIHIRTRATERDTPAGGQRDFVEVQITDNGVGMAPKVLKRIFDPYFTTKGEDGTGLGVPQVQALMHSIGGNVEVTSTPGVGTTFNLLFPISVEPAPISPEALRQIDRWADEGGAIGALAGR